MQTKLVVAVLVGLGCVSIASASPTVAVVVTGDPALQAPTIAQIEGWVRGHGRALGDPLGADTANTIINCFVIDDHPCARNVVDKRSSSNEVVFVRVERMRSPSTTVAISMFWLVKDHEPIGEHRACEQCSDDVLRGTIDTLLNSLASASQTARGRVKVHSKPEGMTVVLDNERIGVTPIERELPVGTHTIVLSHGGQKVGSRTIAIQADADSEITIPVVIPTVEGADPHPRLGAGLALGIGAAACAAGAVLYATSETDDGSKPTFRNTRPVGLVMGAGGIALLAVGALLSIRAGSESSTPTASLDRHGGMVGWARAF